MLLPLNEAVQMMGIACLQQDVLVQDSLPYSASPSYKNLNIKQFANDADAGSSAMTCYSCAFDSQAKNMMPLI